MELNFRTQSKEIFKHFLIFSWLAGWELMSRKYVICSDPVEIGQVNEVLFGETGILENSQSLSLPSAVALFWFCL